MWELITIGFYWIDSVSADRGSDEDKVGEW